MYSLKQTPTIEPVSANKTFWVSAFRGSRRLRRKNTGLLNVSVEGGGLRLSRPLDLYKDAIVPGVRESVGKVKLRR
jgi:hypothetical protein